jgi:hypothetical protein
VESPYAIIPEECRSRIDDGYVISADGIRAELKTARQVDGKLIVTFVITNTSKSSYRFALGQLSALDVKTSSGIATSVRASGLPSCSVRCGENFSDYYSTRIAKGRSALIVVEASISGSEQPKTATVIVPIVRWRTSYGESEVLISFSDIALSSANDPKSGEAELGATQ